MVLSGIRAGSARVYEKCAEILGLKFDGAGACGRQLRFSGNGFGLLRVGGERRISNLEMQIQSWRCKFWWMAGARFRVAK